MGDTRRGEYELQAMNVLMKKGHRVLLGSERSTMGIKICDGYIDDQRMEIKAIEGDGIWAVSTKLLNATKQRAQCVVLLFPDKQLYSEFRIQEGLRLFVIAEDSIVSYWNRKTTPFCKEHPALHKVWLVHFTRLTISWINKSGYYRYTSFSRIGLSGWRSLS